MKDKNLKKRAIIGSAVLVAALVVFAVVAFFLADAKVLNVNPFKLMFAILALGIGVVFIVYSFIVKGGYEFVLGGVLLTVGAVVISIGLLKWYGVVIIAAACLLLIGILSVAMNAGRLIVKRTDEEKEEK